MHKTFARARPGARAWLLASLLAAPFAAVAADKPASLRFCLVDLEVPPWILNDSEGLAQIFIYDLMKRLGVAVSIERMPARRCTLEVQRGEIDATMGSYNPERGAYPMAGDVPDSKRRVGQLGYSLFRTKGTSVGFDGKTITGNSAPIAANQGASIADILKQMNVATDDSTRISDQVLRKVLLGRASAAALVTESGDKLIAAPEFAGKFERVDPPLVSRPYFLILSKKLASANPAFAEQVWDTAAVVRESTAFRKKFDELH